MSDLYHGNYPVDMTVNEARDEALRIMQHAQPFNRGTEAVSLVMQSTPEETVDGFEIRIGNECVKVHFGRKMPITHAVKLARSWLSTIAPEKHP